jgi:hypothetical protein
VAKLSGRRIRSPAVAIARLAGRGGDRQQQVGENVREVEIECGRGQRLKIIGHTSIRMSIHGYMGFWIWAFGWYQLGLIEFRGRGVVLEQASEKNKVPPLGKKNP